ILARSYGTKRRGSAARCAEIRIHLPESGNYEKTGHDWSDLVADPGTAGSIVGRVRRESRQLSVSGLAAPLRFDPGAGGGNGPASAAGFATSGAGIWAAGCAGCADEREGLRIH